MKGEKILFVIPTYNERDNVFRVAEGVFRYCPDSCILFIDDSSPDGTGETIEEMAKKDPRIRLISRNSKAGLGTAYTQGFRYAIDEGFDIVFEMDADLSHDPSFIPLFLKEIETSDMVLGSRYIKGGVIRGWSRARHLISYGGSLFSRIALSLPVRDNTGGFKCIRRRVIEAIDLSNIFSKGFAFQIEFTFKAHFKGFRIKEIPILFTPRMGGRSKMSCAIILEGIWTVMRLRYDMLFHSRMRRWFKE